MWWVQITHPDFPAITIQVAKHHVQVEQEGEKPYECEVQLTAPPESEVPTETTMAAALGQEGGEDENS